MNLENMTEKTMSFTKINLVSIPFSILIAGITFSIFLSNIEYPKEEIYKLSLLTCIFEFMVSFSVSMLPEVSKRSNSV